MSETRKNRFIDVLHEPTRNKFVKILLEHSLLDFKTIYAEFLQMSETTARHHLKQLLDYEIITKVKVKGSKSIYLRINNQYLEPMRRNFNIPRDFVYFGLIGELGISQLNHFIETLSHNNWKFNKLIVFSKVETIREIQNQKDWKGITKKYPGSELIAVPLLEYKDIYEILLKAIEKILPTYSILADITGLTKLHTIALYSLAHKYDLERVYIPRDESQNIFRLP